MAGRKLVLPQPFTDQTLPVLRDDSVLTPGSLYLSDLSHAANPTTGFVNLTSGVPANAAPVYNVAWKESAAVVGGTQTTLGGLVNGGSNPTKYKAERTSNGGLHVVVSQATALAAGEGMMMVLPALVKSWLFNNPTHAYYLSAWDQLTRINAGTVSATGAAEYEVAAGNNTAAVALFRADTAWQSAISKSLTASQVSANNVAGPRFLAAAVTGAALTSATFTNGGAVWGAPAGTFNNAVLASRNLFWPSFAAYRFYLEDLTVSGRSFSTVAAADFASYTTQVLTAGGRYYGDTFTAPATLLA